MSLTSRELTESDLESGESFNDLMHITREVVIEHLDWRRLRGWIIHHQCRCCEKIDRPCLSQIPTCWNPEGWAKSLPWTSCSSSSGNSHGQRPENDHLRRLFSHHL